MTTQERQVTIHIYDFHGVGTRTNAFLSSMSLGLHHSGVEVSGREYSFNDQGVFSSPVHACARGDAPQCKLNQSIFVGVHRGSLNEFNGVLNELRRDFSPGSYALTSKNCNDFADALCAVREPNVEMHFSLRAAMHFSLRAAWSDAPDHLSETLANFESKLRRRGTWTFRGDESVGLSEAVGRARGGKAYGPGS